jgi:hypothetical protein
VAQLLANHGILSQNLVNDIAEAKQTRIDTQYYIATELNQKEIRKNAETARTFVLKIEQTIENITPKQINTIRTLLKEAREAARK